MPKHRDVYDLFEELYGVTDHAVVDWAVFICKRMDRDWIAWFDDDLRGTKYGRRAIAIVKEHK